MQISFSQLKQRLHRGHKPGNEAALAWIFIELLFLVGCVVAGLGAYLVYGWAGASEPLPPIKRERTQTITVEEMRRITDRYNALIVAHDEYKTLPPTAPDLIRSPNAVPTTIEGVE